MTVTTWTDDRILAPAELTVETRIRGLETDLATCRDLAVFFALQDGQEWQVKYYNRRAEKLLKQINALREGELGTHVDIVAGDPLEREGWPYHVEGDEELPY